MAEFRGPHLWDAIDTIDAAWRELQSRGAPALALSKMEDVADFFAAEAAEYRAAYFRDVLELTGSDRLRTFLADAGCSVALILVALECDLDDNEWAEGVLGRAARVLAEAAARRMDGAHSARDAINLVTRYRYGSRAGVAR